MRDGAGWMPRRGRLAALAITLVVTAAPGLGMTGGAMAAASDAVAAAPGAFAAAPDAAFAGGVAPGAAFAGGTASARATSPAPVCQVRDGRLVEISGMAATKDGYVVVNDGSDEESRRRIFFLGPTCAVTRAVGYPSRPLDTEDLALGPDGTIWVADIGDNDRSRSTVAVWKLSPGANRPVLYRLAYPDGPHDAEAMLLTGDGRPLLVTKFSGVLYAPQAPLTRAGATTPLTRVGQVRLPATTTSNPFSFLGRTSITGAATAPDGRRVLLRTYADAFEFDVPDGDVVAALTGGTPRIVPLPDEPQGEAVTYSRDGRMILTVSEGTGQGRTPTILRYPVSAPEPTSSAPSPRASPVEPSPPTAAPTPPAGADNAAGRPGGSVVLAAVLTVAGVVLVGALAVGLALRSVRRRRRAAG
ncbi:hypothetical protein [Plantactinospora sp. GCM10030261]|uniref:hypothetical protein n=1 Tax=Plantactinospora sp. GCM10030261 TaxID=3273420 RepID=UPI00361FEE1D